MLRAEVGECEFQTSRENFTRRNFASRSATFAEALSPSGYVAADDVAADASAWIVWISRGQAAGRSPNLPLGLGEIDWAGLYAGRRGS